MRPIILIIALSCLSACELLHKQEDPDAQAMPVITKPLPPEKAKEVAGEIGKNWVYGQGLGDAALTAGAVLVFPPYLAVVLGNAGLSLAGYEPLSVTQAMSPEAADEYRAGYDAIAGAPGRMAAAVAGEEYRTNERARADMKRTLQEISATQGQQPTTQVQLKVQP